MTYILQQYIAERDGETITGTSGEIEEALHLCRGYAAGLARTGKRTRSGWTVRIVEGSQIECEIPQQARYWSKMNYRATRKGEDPIIGSLNEISALTGINDSSLRDAVKKGRTDYKGWHIVPATPDEVAQAEKQWA